MPEKTGLSTCIADGVIPRGAIDYLTAFAEARVGSAQEGAVARETGARTVVAHVRRSEVSWMSEEDAEPVMPLIGELVRAANEQMFGFDLEGLTEPFQVATYRAAVHGEYGWHIDTGPGRLARRKISVIIPLTDPANYEGGQFDAFYDHEPTTIAMPLGRIVMFPSYVLHRVRPVTAGVRRSLAVWVSGPPFR